MVSKNANDYFHILIYGAHLVAQECCRYLVQDGHGDRIIGFAVTSPEGNPRELEGYAVKSINQYEDHTDALVVIAVPEKYHDEIEKQLRGSGFFRIDRVGLKEMSILKGKRLIDLWKQRISGHAEKEFSQGQIFPQEQACSQETASSRNCCAYTLRESPHDFSWLDLTGADDLCCKFPTLYHLPSEQILDELNRADLADDYGKVCGNTLRISSLRDHAVGQCSQDVVSDASHASLGKDPAHDSTVSTDGFRIYMTTSQWDSDAGVRARLDPWVHPLQVGAVIADRIVCETTDAEGDNISTLNRGFAELCATYWVWKNVNTAEYKGICHYRRHFDLSEEAIRGMCRAGVDVLLTTARYAPGGVREMFLAETPVKQQVLDSLRAGIRTYAAEDAEAFEVFLSGEWYFPNNMVIARTSVYDAYASWLFPILLAMQDADEKSGYGHETDRHIAYAAELLTSYYFMRHHDHLKLAVTDYVFYG